MGGQVYKGSKTGLPPFELWLCFVGGCLVLMVPLFGWFQRAAIRKPTSFGCPNKGHPQFVVSKRSGSVTEAPLSVSQKGVDPKPHWAKDLGSLSLSPPGVGHGSGCGYRGGLSWDMKLSF